MPIDPPSDVIVGLVEASIGGALGRILHYTITGRWPSRGVAILYELPAALALGIVGLGVAEYLHLDGWAAVAVIIVTGFGGVKIINLVIERATGAKKP